MTVKTSQETAGCNLQHILTRILGEEFLFSGIMLSKMEGVFSPWIWAAIIAYSAQSIFFTFLIPGIVLGMA